MSKPALSHLTAPDGHQIVLYSWEPTGTLVGVIHICHGMAEHALRYGELANRLVGRGWLVVAQNHRGHGELPIEVSEPRSDDAVRGHFADQNGWEKVTDDVGQVQKHLKQSHSSLPIVLMGHSMGALIVQGYLVRKPAFWPDGVILSGTSRESQLQVRALRMVVAFEAWRLGSRHPSTVVNKLTFGSFNKSVENPATDFDWLSHDTAAVRAYVEDPLCGFACTTGLWRDLGNGLMTITAPESFSGLPKSLPIYVLSGGKDPVGAFGKAPRSLAKALADAGLTRVDMRIYPDMRHEPLHEVNRASVISELEQWLDPLRSSINVLNEG